MTGFWRRYTIAAELSDTVNFLIGENGSGKTTLINLLAACLTADFLTLDRMSFSSVELNLRSYRDRRIKPKIVVNKKSDASTGIESIDYVIHPSATSDPIRFSLEDIEEQRIIRQRPGVAPNMYYREYRVSRRKRDLTSQLSNLVSVVWLSIHRSTLLNDVEDRRVQDKGYDSTVDLKLSELSSRLSRYYSSLVSMRDSSVKDIQEFTLLSILEERNDQKFFTFLKEIDIDEQKSALIEAFETIGLRREKFLPKANKYFKTVAEAKGRTTAGYPIQQIQAMVVLQQIQQITEKWRKEKARQDDIFEDYNSFIGILNDLFRGKIITVDKSAQIVARNDRGDDMDIFKLSSGEKQLLILLGEALLQEHSSCIYIADEPELSLHVRWQEQIIPSILKLNESAQMIVATHSPDIVGSYLKNVMRMEKLLVES